MQQIRLKLSDITIDRAIQMRAEANPEIVAEYAAAYKAGATLPPLTVFNDGKARWLADGFQRYEAAKKTAEKILHCNEFRGTRRDAMLFSIGANGTHGVRRTNADKRKAIMALLSDPEWAKWSTRELAERAHVSNAYVSELKTEQGTTQGVNVNTPAHGASNGNTDLQESTQCAKHKKKSHKKAENEPVTAQKEEDVIPDESNAESPLKSAESAELNAAYESHQATRALSARLHEIIREWESLGRDAHPFISEQSVTSHLKAAVAEIRMGQPYAVCPYCQGGKTCKESLCQKTGWLPKTKFDNTPSELKIGAVILK